LQNAKLVIDLGSGAGDWSATIIENMPEVLSIIDIDWKKHDNKLKNKKII
jgi:ribosomal protein L11 methylase PrmA